MNPSSPLNLDPHKKAFDAIRGPATNIGISNSMGIVARIPKHFLVKLA
jgi:hypothetical protein